jgi:hypothetical protein
MFGAAIFIYNAIFFQFEGKVVETGDDKPGHIHPEVRGLKDGLNALEVNVYRCNTVPYILFYR